MKYLLLGYEHPDDADEAFRTMVVQRLLPDYQRGNAVTIKGDKQEVLDALNAVERSTEGTSE